MAEDSIAALRFGEFRDFISAKFLLTLGTNMLAVLIGWKIYEYTKDAFMLGLIGLVEFVPALLLSFFVGHWVDISEKRSLLLWCYAFTVALSCIPLLFCSDYFSWRFSEANMIWALFATMFLLGIARAFISPSAFSLIHQLVDHEVLQNASTWNSTSWQFASVIAPAIAGFWYAKYGGDSIFLTIIIILIFATWLIYRIKPKPILYKQSENVLASLKEGIDFVLKNKAILWAISLDMLAVLFGGAVALLPIFADQILNCGAEGFGWLRAATSMGTILVLLLITYFPIVENPGKKMIMAVIGFGVCMVVFGLSEWFWLSFLALFLSGVFDGISVNGRSNILQFKIPHEMKGRVNSVNSVFVSSSNELGAFESGVTAHWWGPQRAVAIGGMVTVGIATLVYFKVKSLAKLTMKYEGS